jgi:CubicO group peptidase (beta-lactamase class C family)
MAWREDAARSLTETFDGAFDSPGVVVAAACVDEAGAGIGVSPGDAAADGRFEIGSVTKTMTAALLALLADDGALSLDDEVGRWLSAGPNGGITLRQLATHISGLPRLAPNMDVSTVDPANPYGGFGFERAEEGLRQATAAAERPWLYSNFGYHLLGLVLERASGQSYQALVTRRLLEPLAMTCSGVEDAGTGTRLPGHAGGGEVPHWDHPLGAGGVEATVADLGRYAQACLHPPGTPLGAAITAAMAPQIPLANGGRQALAWQVRPDGIRVHGGGTGGFSSAVLVDQGRGRQDPNGKTAPARSSGCCSTGGPRTSTPSGRPRSRATCQRSGWSGPGAPGHRTSARRARSRSAARDRLATSPPTSRSPSPATRSPCGSASSRPAS